MKSRQYKRILLAGYFVATIQFVWCYLWLTRAYVNTIRYERGVERMPFQGRVLMMWALRAAHNDSLLKWLARQFERSPFWFANPVSPEVLIQAVTDVICLLLSGVFVTKVYEKSSDTGLLAPFVYPVMLMACVTTYVMHTVQNFRFIYDFPSLMFFAASLYLIYFRKHWIFFCVVFVIATLNRETSLLMLPIFMLDRAVDQRRFRWASFFERDTLLVVLPLAAAWGGWQLIVRRIYVENMSEFYPRLDWNIKSLIAPHAWPQMFSACGYLLAFVVMTHRWIRDRRIHAYLWIIPLWVIFMFVYGILIETRVFGELIPLAVCATMLIIERRLIMGLRDYIPSLPTLQKASIIKNRAA